MAASPLRPAFAQGKKYRFGFSQSTTLEPWRVQFNKDMKREADQHPEIELLISDGQDKTEKQVADVENFIRQGVDVLLISPKESAGLTGVTLKAIEAGIPVIVLDRNVNTDKYTQFIGGDNVVIGRAAGEYAVKALGGAGQGQGQRRRDLGRLRHPGVARPLERLPRDVDKEKGIKLVNEKIDCDWKQNKAYDLMANLLKAQRADRPRLRAQRPHGLWRLSRRQGCRPRERHQVPWRRRDPERRRASG